MKNLKDYDSFVNERLNYEFRIPASYTDQYFMALFICRFVNYIQLKWQQRRGNAIIAYLNIDDFSKLINSIVEDKSITINCSIGPSIKQYKKATLEYKSGSKLLKYDVEPKNTNGEILSAKWGTDSILDNIDTINNIINNF